jgi:O-antigen/teichoic acid export membrane protein
MIITILIALYSTRLVLNALGASDYGVYNLVAGVIAFLSFLNGAMSTATQRFLSFHQGRKDVEKQKTVFTNSLILHILLGLCIVVILEIAGFFLFDGFLNIPVSRIETAKGIYHFMSVTVFFTIINAPFIGSLTAHENMIYLAIVNIVEALLKLSIGLVLFVITEDRLMWYGFLMAFLSLATLSLYAFFCFSKYDECTTKGFFSRLEKPLLKELFSFASWSLFGAACTVSRTQGSAIILNLFFGSVVNAAYAIGNQVSSQMNFFSSTMMQAMNPQLMKSEGAGNRGRLLELAMLASKYGFFLFAFIAIPAIFEMPAILMFWLNQVPPNTVIFCRLLVIAILTNQLTIGLQSAVQAIGKIKAYQITVGTTLLLNMPLGYLLLRMGMPAYAMVAGFIVAELVACCLRGYFMRKLGGLSIRAFINRVLIKELIPVFMAIIVSYLVTTFLDFPYRFIFTIAISSLAFFVTVYFFGTELQERDKLKSLIFNMINKKG